MEKKEETNRMAWWAIIIFSVISLANKLWVREDALATIAWAFLVVWAAAECKKDWKRNMAAFAIEAILFAGTLAILVWDICSLTK